jgi:hypothetical protein
LVCAFSSAAEREAKLAAFYGSDEWRDRFEQPVSALVESYQVVVLKRASELQDLSIGTGGVQRGIQ